VNPTRTGAPAQARHQQRVEELCLAAIRALSGEADLHFRGRLLHRGRKPVPVHAPQLYPDDEDDFASFRGAADGMALRLAHSDLDLHRTLAPDDPVERLLFEMLEQFRVEALTPPELPGVRANLGHRHRQWSLAFHESGLTGTTRGILLYTVAQICRARVCAEPVLEETEDELESTRGALAPILGHDLARLRPHRSDQAAYARHALAISHRVARMLDDVTASEDDESGDRDTLEDRAAFPLFVDFDEESGGVTPAATATRGVRESAREPYRAFTTEYDRQVEVGALVRPALLRRYREELDHRVDAQGVNIARLARDLRAVLAEPVHDGWTGGQEEGHVDGRRLAQLIASPTERRLFQTPRIESRAQCLVSILVDCSGSMKEHAEPVALIVDVLGRALDLAGVSTEVLGFTTGAWNGGRAQQAWQRAGRPSRPGRLNELSHIVFKDAELPWRRARRAVAGLQRADLFREGVDGEAVQWACGRMAGRPEERRVLVVVSDGSPRDSATVLANDEHYLDDHLGQVVLEQEQLGEVAVCGLGVGLDLSPYYGRALALDLADGVRNSVFGEIRQLLAGAAPRA
jgi:cobaltochelatase CobT